MSLSKIDGRPSGRTAVRQVRLQATEQVNLQVSHGLGFVFFFLPPFSRAGKCRLRLISPFDANRPFDFD